MPRSLFFALIVLSLIWGGSFYFIKVLLEDFGPWTIAFLRCTLGFVTIVIIMLVLRKPFNLRAISWPTLSIMAIVNTVIPWTIIAYSETRLTSSMTSVINATTPIWTLLVGMIFFRAVTNRKQWAGMAIAFAGLIVLLGLNPQSIISVDLIGFLSMLAATLSYAFGSQLSKSLLQKFSMYQITLGTLLCGMIVSGIVAISIESIAWDHISNPSSLSAMLGLGVLGSGVGYVLFFHMVQKGSPEFASMVTYLVPATAIFWGYLLLNETIGWNLFIGLALILGGVYQASRKTKHRAGR